MSDDGIGSVIKEFGPILGILMIATIIPMFLSQPTQASTNKGSIIVNTNPEGATVKINGTVVGVSPIMVNINPGTYTVLIQLSGYNDISTSITITSEETRTLNVSLIEIGSEWTPIDIEWL